MCECNLLADGVFTPLTIKESKVSLKYVDALGKAYTLIDSFSMDFVATNATVKECKDTSGKIVSYLFEIKGGNYEKDTNVICTQPEK